ncbi:hypothetical protein HZA85_02840 [Candidatus Uhrbacteria bacterium]|nr:hypothetical protein [Candidatus Uhrbacteria bacterium]
METRCLFWIAFVVVAMGFFLGSLTLSVAGGGQVFVSPDETANAFFARRFSQTGTLRVPDVMTKAFSDALYPRSIVASEGELVPQSFLGLPVLYGSLAFFFGPGILFMLTPLLAILCALALRPLLRRWFSDQVASLSALLFLLHPAVWYYSARGLMHSVLFVCLLIFGAYFFFCHPLEHHLARCEKRFGKMMPFQRQIDPVVGGVLVGFALFVRASEVVWVGAAILLLVMVSLRQTSIKKDFGRFLVGLAIGLLPFFLFNALTYGNALATGYTLHNSVNAVRSAVQSAPHGSSLFPFGLDLKASASHIRDYGLMLFWWLTALALLGFPIVAAKRPWYAVLFVMITVWLGLWYGSWTFFDNPDPHQITIANSYVRYGLPSFILAIPFVAEAIGWLSARAQTSWARGMVVSALVVLVAGLNVHLIFFQGQDGLSRVRETLLQTRQVKQEVLAQIPEDAVIVVDRSDKVFFPERHVRYPLRSDQTYELLPALAQAHPLYYFGITFPQRDLDYLNESKLPPLGLNIRYLKTDGEESLYQFYFP